MAEIQIVVCDVCGKTDRQTTRYRISKGTSSTHYDLCEEHARPVEMIISTKSAQSARRVFEDNVATPDEIKRKKAERAARSKQQPSR